MGIFILWIVMCFVAGSIGSDRKIGFTSAFFLSLFFSPLVGCSSDDDTFAGSQEDLVGNWVVSRQVFEGVDVTDRVSECSNMQYLSINEQGETVWHKTSVDSQECFDIMDELVISVKRNGTLEFEENIPNTSYSGNFISRNQIKVVRNFKLYDSPSVSKLSGITELYFDK